jgi:alcohol dehydrogenase (cytochrome c)
LTWASGIGSNGRPALLPEQAPTPAGAKICPPIEGATNWFSTAFSPETGLYYVQTLEKCGIYTKSNAEWKAGASYVGGTTRNIPDDDSRKVLRAFDIQTGEPVWELPQFGDAESWVEFWVLPGAWSSFTMTMDHWPPQTHAQASGHGVSRRAACRKHPP